MSASPVAATYYLPMTATYYLRQRLADGTLLSRRALYCAAPRHPRPVVIRIGTPYLASFGTPYVASLGTIAPRRARREIHPAKGHSRTKGHSR